MFVHLWIGNNAQADGEPQDDKTLRSTFKPERLKALEAETNQASRYRMLATDVWESAKTDVGGTVERRLRSGMAFAVGGDWLGGSNLTRDTEHSDLPAWLIVSVAIALRVKLLAMLVVGLIGWRWSCGWSRDINLASLAMLWIPLPYVLSHAEHFSGPRLPLDGPLLCFAAYTLARVLSGGQRRGVCEADGV